MTEPSPSGHKYRRKLPHIRIPGGIYHVRLRIHSSFSYLKSDLDFKIIEDALMFVHKKSCILLAYVIMPNHTHMVIQPLPTKASWSAWCDYTEQHRVEDILGSIKKFSARRINLRHLRTGEPFWESECFDRVMRNEDDLEKVIDYIHGNPVRWGLTKRPEDYRWTSASTIYSGNKRFRDWFS